MNELFKELNDKTKAFNLGCKNKTITMDNINSYVYDIINTAAKHYKDNDFNVYIPYLENGPAMWQEEDRIYVPIFSDLELIDLPNVVGTKKVRLKDVCSGLYNNMIIYELANNPDNIPSSDYSLNEIKEYISHNAKIDGIMYNPSTDYIFGFDRWIFKALFFKGIGVDTFSVIDANTGEVKERL